MKNTGKFLIPFVLGGAAVIAGAIGLCIYCKMKKGTIHGCECEIDHFDEELPIEE